MFNHTVQFRRSYIRFHKLRARQYDADLSAGLRQLKPSLDEAGKDHDGLSSVLVACDSAVVSTWTEQRASSEDSGKRRIGSQDYVTPKPTPANSGQSVPGEFRQRET